jgi:hypothetical protein
MLFTDAPSLSEARYSGPIFGKLTKVSFVISSVEGERGGSPPRYVGPSVAVCVVAQFGRVEWTVDLVAEHKYPVTSFSRAGPEKDALMNLIFSDGRTSLVALDESRLGQRLWVYPIPDTALNGTVTLGTASAIVATNRHVMFSQVVFGGFLANAVTDVVTTLQLLDGRPSAFAPVTDHITARVIAWHDVLYVPLDHEVSVLNATTGLWITWWPTASPVLALHMGDLSHKKDKLEAVVFGTNYSVFAFSLF